MRKTGRKKSPVDDANMKDVDLILEIVTSNNIDCIRIKIQTLQLCYFIVTISRGTVFCIELNCGLLNFEKVSS